MAGMAFLKRLVGDLGKAKTLLLSVPSVPSVVNLSCLALGDPVEQGVHRRFAES